MIKKFLNNKINRVKIFALSFNFIKFQIKYLGQEKIPESSLKTPSVVEINAL